MTRASVSSHKWLFISIIALSCIVAAIVTAPKAFAEADVFLDGNGQDGIVNFGLGTHRPNAIAPVSGAVSAGATSLTRGTVTAGSGSNTVTFANGRLVLIIQGSGWTGAAVSGSQTAVNMSGSQVGDWELARISTVSGTTLNFTNPLINSYANGTTQVVAVPEYDEVTVNNAGANITGRPWDGQIGGVVAMLIDGTINFTASGTVQANGLGFRGGVSYDEHPNTNITNCPLTQMNGDTDGGFPAAMKGEGIYPSGYKSTSPATNDMQEGRGNYLNSGGGGVCFNASGGGGSNAGAGGVGGNTLVDYTDGNRAAGGLGGAPLTYNAYDRAVFGGGGGAGERNNDGSGNGGAGGGFVMVRGTTLSGTGQFRANGTNGEDGDDDGQPYDGAGGGGAGGNVVLRFVNGATCNGVSANGGAGGNNSTDNPYDWTPGGGAGGGRVYVQGSSVACASSVTAGAAGTNGGNTYGAAAGSAGAATANATGMATPTATITSPANSSFQPSTTPTITGTSAANAEVYVYVDSAFVGIAYADGSGNWALVTGALSQGAHSVYVRPELYGISGVNTSTNNFTVDTVMPAVNISAPTAGAYLTDTTPSATFTATDANAGTTTCATDGGAFAACSSPYTTAALSDGPHSISVNHTDLAGNSTTVVRNFTIDTTSPVVTISAPTEGSTTGDNTPNISFSATDANLGTTTCSVNGGAFSACSSPFTTSTLPDGPNSVAVRHTDLAGLQTTTTRNFIVDTTGPAAPTINTGPASYAASTSATLTFTGAEGGGTYQCRIDGGSWGACTSPANYAGLIQGSHTFEVRQIDGVGNIGAIASRTWIVDTVSPAVAISSPTAGSYTTDNTPDAVFTATDANAGTTTCSVDSGPYVACSSPFAMGTLGDGVHNIAVRHQDLAGNATVVNQSFTVDTTPPVVTISAPTEGSNVGDNTPDITFSATDTNAGTTTCSVNGGAYGPCSSPFTTPSLPDGPNSVSVRHTDLAGLQTTTTRNFIVDTTAPAAPVITSPADGFTTNDTTPTISGTAEANSSLEVFADGISIGTTTTDGSGNWTLTPVAPLSMGDHEITAIATDSVGNESAESAAVTITIDTSVPAVTITAPAEGEYVNDSTPQIDFGVVDNGSVTIECSVDGGAFVACGPTNYTTGSLLDGGHFVTVRATDAGGNIGQAVVNFIVDTVAPGAPTIDTPLTGLVTADTTPTLTGTAEIGSTVIVYQDGFAIGSTVTDGSGNWSFTPGAPIAEGTYDFTATATDEAGNEGADSNTVEITIDTTAPAAPVISSPSNGFQTNDTTPTVSGTAEANSTVRVYADGNLVGTTTADGSGNWTLDTSALAEGDYELTATSEDEAGNDSLPSTGVNITIDTTAPSAPAITSPSDGTVTADTTPTVSGTAEADSTVRVYADGNLVGTTTADGSGNWTLDTSALAEGDYELTATAQDEAGNTSLPSSIVDITIDTTAPSAPVIASPADGTSTNDSTPTVSGTAEASSTVRVYADGNLVGTTTADINGDWTLDTSALVDGDYELTATAEDAAGNDSLDSNIVDITVDTIAPNAPAITSPSDGTVTSDTTPTVSGTAEAGSTVRVYADGNLVGTTTADINGDWTLDTSALAEGDYELTATAEDAATNVSPASSIVDITIDTTAPAAPAITSPADGTVTSDTTPTVSGTAEANSTVRVYADGNLVGTTTADINGDWTLDTSALAEGDYELTATAEDAADNVSLPSSIVDITIDTTAPNAPAITSPADGTVTSDTTPTVSGTAEANSTVRVYADGNLVGTTTADINGDWTLDASTLADGDYELTATAEDAADNLSPSSSIVDITIDTAAPAAPVVSTPADGSVTNDSTPQITGTAEANSIVEVFVDGVSIGSVNADGSGNWTITPGSPLAEGDRDITATSTDAANNTSVLSNVNTVTIDLTAPNAPAITSPADGTVTNDTTPTVSGTAEANSTVRVYADGNLVGTTTADINGDWTLDTSALTEGDYELTATAEDAATNVSLPSSIVDITIDTTAPAAPAITSPADGTVTNDTTPTVSGTAEAGSTVRVYADGNLVGTTTADINGDWTLDTSALAEGDYELTATAEDAASNVSLPSSIVDITIDTTAPAAPLISAPVDGSSTQDTTPTISGTAEPNSIVEVFVDGVSIGSVPADGSGNWTITPVTPLAEGDRDITAVAADAANNPSIPSSTVTVTIDTTDPVLTIDAPGANEEITTNTPDIEFTATDDGPITVTCSVDGGAFVPCSSPFGIGPLTEGDHTVVVNVEDEAGNDTQQSVTFTVDTIAPETQLDSTPPVLTNSDDATFEFSSEVGATFECSVDGGAYSSCSSPLNLTGLLDGLHTIDVRATDTAGNTDATPASYSWTVDTIAPAAPTITGPTDGSSTNDGTPEITGTATPGSTVTIYVDGSPIGTTTADGNGDWTFTPSTPLPEGDNAITATETDDANNESVPSSTVDLTVDTVAPNTSIVSQPPNPSNDNSPTFDFSADEAVDHYECNLDGAGWSTCTDPLNLSGLSDASHTLEVRAVDLAGNTDATPASYTWTVDTLLPPAPVITGPADNTTTTDNTPTISGTAEANSEVTVYVDGNPIGTVTTNGSGVWTITSTLLADGDYEITATAEDAAGNTSPTSAITDLTVDTTPPNGNVVEQTGTGGPGVAPTFNITSDDPGATTTCSISGGPATPCTSPFTPTGLGPGSYTLLVTYTDEAGNTSNRSVNFTVAATSNPNPPITPEADPLPAACFPKGITIYELKIAGSKLQIRGFARSQYVGKEVTLNFQPTKTKVIGKAKVQADGSFFAVVPAPKKALRKKGTTRYRANVDGESSFWFKLDRRMGSNLATYSGGNLNVAGFLTKPLDPKSKLTVTVRTGCNDPWTKIGDVKINRGGAFKGAIPYATDSKVLFVRMYAKVRKTPKGKATLTTYSFAIPVVTGR